MPRRSVRLKGHDYSSPCTYFVTVCTQRRVNVFGHIDNGVMHLNDRGKIVDEEWVKTGEIRSNVFIDEYTVMPNHFHGIIILKHPALSTVSTVPHLPCRGEPAARPYRVNRVIQNDDKPSGTPPGSLGAIMAQFESLVTKRIRTTIDPAFQWQRGYYDRIVRTQRGLYRLRNYIRNNPKNWHRDKENPNNDLP